MKKIFGALFALVFILSFTVVPSAASYSGNVLAVDNAGLLTEEEKSALEERLSVISDMYNFDVVILTVSSLGYKSAQQYADDFFDYNGYGAGEERSGILFLVAVEPDNREYHFSTCGTGEDIITGRRFDRYESAVLPYLKGGDYYGAFEEFIALTEEFLSDPYPEDDIDSPGYIKSPEEKKSDIIKTEIFAFIAAVVIGFIVTGIEKSKLKAPTLQKTAGDYVVKDSFELKESRDMFMYSTVTKTAKPKNTSSGGSGSHIGSSGRSHGGRGGHF